MDAVFDYLNVHVGPAVVYESYSGNVWQMLLEWLTQSVFWLGLMVLLVVLLLFTLVR